MNLKKQAQAAVQAVSAVENGALLRGIFPRQPK